MARSRVILISGEELELSAVIQYSPRFLEQKEFSVAFNLHSHLLSDVMLILDALLKEEIDSYWREHLAGKKLANIRSGYTQAESSEFDDEDSD